MRLRPSVNEKPSLEKQTQARTKTETVISAQGQVLPSEVDHNTQIYLARTAENNARKAEALLYTEPADPFQELRTLLSRGQFEDAEKKLAELNSSLDATAVHSRVELYLDQSRLAAYRNDWIKSLELCNEGLALNPTVVTRMTLLQVRSLALFELGQFAGARKDIDLISSLATLFPATPNAFYAGVLKARIAARTGGVQAGFAQLMPLRKHLQQATSGGRDLLLTLLRTEIDLLRLNDQNITAHAVACFVLAEQMGDELYAGLAFLDLYLSVSLEFRKALEGTLKVYSSRFEKLRSLLNEVETGIPGSTSSKTIKMAVAIAASPDFLSQAALTAPQQIKSLVLLSAHQVIELDPFRIRTTEFQEKAMAVLQIMKAEPILKAELMKRVWNVKYSSHLHDSVLRTTFTRLRKTTGATIRSAEGKVTLEGVLILP